MQIDETLSNVISYDGEQLLEVRKIDDLLKLSLLPFGNRLKGY